MEVTVLTRVVANQEGSFDRRWEARSVDRCDRFPLLGAGFVPMSLQHVRGMPFGGSVVGGVRVLRRRSSRSRSTGCMAWQRSGWCPGTRRLLRRSAVR